MPQQSPNSAITGIGFRVHSGWAAAVAVVYENGSPWVVDRRCIEICDPRLPGAKQPFHAMEVMDLKQAERKLLRFTDSTNSLARVAIKGMIDDLASSKCQAVSSCILLASGRQAGNLASILASHAMIH